MGEPCLYFVAQKVWACSWNLASVEVLFSWLPAQPAWQLEEERVGVCHLFQAAEAVVVELSQSQEKEMAEMSLAVHWELQ